MTWSAIWVLAAGTYAMKAAGPVLIGRRGLPLRLQRLVMLLAAALLAALIALATLSDGGDLAIDWGLVAGVGAAAVAIRLRAPLVVVIVAAAAVAALIRAVG